MLLAGSAALGSRSAVVGGAESRDAGDPQPLTITPPPPPLTAPRATLEVDGARIGYWDTGGARPAVVLLHPSTGSWDIWGYQQAPFAAAGYRVIGYSRRGYTGSTSGDTSKPGTAAEDLRRLLDHLRIERAHLLGTAAGGITSTAFALTEPERVRSLVLACTLFSGGERAVSSMLTSMREPWYNALPHEFRELGPSYRAINPEGVKHWHDLHAGSKGDNPPLSQPMGQALTVANAAQLKMPVLLVSGDADLISPPPVARVFHKAIPGSRLIVLTECGHSAYWERPAEFNAAVLEFLGEQR